MELTVGPREWSPDGDSLDDGLPEGTKLAREGIKLVLATIEPSKEGFALATVGFKDRYPDGKSLDEGSLEGIELVRKGAFDGAARLRLGIDEASEKGLSLVVGFNDWP